MNRERLAKLNVKARVLKAMAHPSRLCIVEELAKKERCVCDLTEIIGADMSTVSKHLTVLKHAGIVADEKRGAMVFYRLRVPCLGKLFETVESVLECSARELAIQRVEHAFTRPVVLHQPGMTQHRQMPRHGRLRRAAIAGTRRRNARRRPAGARSAAGSGQPML
jgi:DNA-binding transcriptional ArsR family regulator